jgi:TolB-like protein
VVGKGYRFIGSVRVIDPRYPHSDFPNAAAVSVSEESTDTWNHHCSLAVLPLFLLGNATDERGLCFGFADALVSHLGNLPGVDVLPTSAVLNVPPDAAGSDLASRLGVRKGQSRLSVEMFDRHLASVCWKRTCHLDLNRLTELEIDMAKQIAAALHRPLRPSVSQRRTRYSNDPLAYAEFMHGYRLSSSGDPTLLDEAAAHLTNAVTRDPAFSLAHAMLSFVWATRHFEYDPARTWLERAEFHCRRALEVDPDLPEGHVANAFLLRAVEKLPAFGSHRRIAARWRYRRICLMPTIVWVQSWLTLASSIMLVKCMSADDPSILKRL